VYPPVGQPVNIECVKCAWACGCDAVGRAPALASRAESAENSAGENPNVAVAMLDPELDDLFFERRRAGFFVDQHQLLRDGVVDSVGFDIKVVVVTDDKCHFVASTSNGQSYKILSPN
jgi:hypothetical protein